MPTVLSRVTLVALTVDLRRHESERWVPAPHGSFKICLFVCAPDGQMVELPSELRDVRASKFESWNPRTLDLRSHSEGSLRRRRPLQSLERRCHEGRTNKRPIDVREGALW